MMLWFLFILISLSFFFVDIVLCCSGPYWWVLLFIAALCMAIAVKIFFDAERKSYALLGVLTIFVIGQWRLIEYGVVQLVWAVNGFAP